jgi:hypothetical protein
MRRLLSLAVLMGLVGAALPAVADAGKPRCRGKKATIVGTKHDDRIRGTNKKDVIVALGATTAWTVAASATSSAGTEAMTT